MPKRRTEEMTQFSVRMPKALKDEIQALADSDERTLAAMIVLLLKRSVAELRPGQS